MSVSFRDHMTEFMAYTKLTAVAHLQNELRGKSMANDKDMSFEEFLNAMQRNEAVDASLSREMPESQVRESEINARYTGKYAQEAQKLVVIEKAYRLGIVDRNDSLIDL